MGHFIAHETNKSLSSIIPRLIMRRGIIDEEPIPKAYRMRVIISLALA